MQDNIFEAKKRLGRDKVSNLINWGHWFAFYNGLLAILIGSKYILALGLPESVAGWGYLTLYTVGQFCFLSFIVYLVCLFPTTLLLPYSRILRGFAAIVATIGLTTLLYDTKIFEVYGIHLSPFAVDLAWTDLNALFHGYSYFITPIIILVIELTLANYLWKRINKIQKRNNGPKVLAVLGTCFIGSHLIHIWADAANVIDITRFDEAYPLSYPATAKSFMERHGIERRQSSLSKVGSETTLEYPQVAMQCTAETKPNVLFISVTSLRKDMLNKETMPFLSQYAQNNIDFTHHFSGGNGYNSSMFSILYSLQTSYMDSDLFAFKTPVLTQEFKHQGYELGLFNSKSFSRNVEPLAMFNDFDKHLVKPHHNNAIADASIIESFKTWKTKQHQPWFALVNLNATETYDTPVGYLGIKTVKTPANYKPAQRVLFNQYRQSASYVDKQLKNLIANISRDTIVVVTGANGAVFDLKNDYKDSLSPQNVEVPLVIHWPGKGKQVVNYRTTHYNIAPTLLKRVLGCSNPDTDYSSGHNLLKPNPNDWVYVGDQRVFAIYQQNEITVIDRHGKYRIYDINFENRLHKKLRAPELIQVMREGRRLYNN